jgi:hypothetical protein
MTRSYGSSPIPMKRYQRKSERTETKVEMRMHKVIYMKPVSGFILDNRTNYSVKGP